MAENQKGNQGHCHFGGLQKFSERPKRNRVQLRAVLVQWPSGWYTLGFPIKAFLKRDVREYSNARFTNNLLQDRASIRALRVHRMNIKTS